MTEEKVSRVNYLDEHILKEICHEMACRLFEDDEPMGLFEEHDRAKVDSCLNLPRQSVFGRELYPTIFKKAAVTFYAFNRNHPFANGNKRISVIAFAVFVYINDYALTATAADVRDKALWIAQTNTPIGEVVEEIAAWAQAHTVPLFEWQKKHSTSHASP